MSSSSSDSDSDEFEPIRKIKINIKPNAGVVKRDGANVDEIKASVEAWRPLGTVTSRGSVSNGNSGTIMRSSPSCSSLVNEFNNRSTFSNFMSTMSRTSSPLTLFNNLNGDAVPIAIAIQESIELTVKGQQGPDLSEFKFDNRILGNIKVAFPSAFAKGDTNNAINKQIRTLKLRMHSTENIIRYYGSKLIKDLDLEASDNGVTETTTATPNASSQDLNINLSNKCTTSTNGNTSLQDKMLQFDLLDLNESPKMKGVSNSKIIEFDMDALMGHLRQLYEQSPSSRYYNVDVLRYQVTPIEIFEKCPLQVCAYWKVEPKLVKLRIDFKHSNRCGFNLERLRELAFSVNLDDFIPQDIHINSMSPDSLSSIKFNSNNNSSIVQNKNNVDNSAQNLLNMNAQNSNTASKHQDLLTSTSLIDDDITYPHNQPCPILATATATATTTTTTTTISSRSPPMPHARIPPPPPISRGGTISKSNSPSAMPPYISYEPQAHWNSNCKQLTWKFDNLLSYYKTDGYGSLLAKIDFRNYDGMPLGFLNNAKPKPVNVKFMVVDSTLSKISMSVDSAGYKMSLLKKEIRSGRYKSEPHIF